MESMKMSAYFADIGVNASLDHAWKTVIDYQAWNPNFANAEVVTEQGEPGAEGEVVRILDRDADGNLQNDFYAETVRIVERHHFTWCVYPRENDTFRNFVDFELLEQPDGTVRFYIQYFEQHRTAPEDLAEQRAAHQAGFEMLTRAFKDYVESHPA